MWKGGKVLIDGLFVSILCTKKNQKSYRLIILFSGKNTKFGKNISFSDGLV